MASATSSRDGSSTRARILNVFVELVAEHGYHATSIANVAAVAGVSKGSVLHHFGNKDELLVEAGISYIERRDVELQHAFSQLERQVDRFAAIVYSTMLAERDDRSASQAFGREFSMFQTDARLSRVREARDRFVTRVIATIEDCMEARVLRPDNSVLVMLQVYGMCNWSWTWYRPDGPLTAEEIAARFTRTLLVGLAPAGADVTEPSIDGERIVALIHEARDRIMAPPTGVS